MLTKITLLHRIAFSFLDIVEALISRNICLQKATNNYTAHTCEQRLHFRGISWCAKSRVHSTERRTLNLFLKTKQQQKHILKSTHNISILRIVSWIYIFYFPQWFHLAPLFHNYTYWRFFSLLTVFHGEMECCSSAWWLWGKVRVSILYLKRRSDT